MSDDLESAPSLAVWTRWGSLEGDPVQTSGPMTYCTRRSYIHIVHATFFLSKLDATTNSSPLSSHGCVVQRVVVLSAVLCVSARPVVMRVVVLCVDVLHVVLCVCMLYVVLHVLACTTIRSAQHTQTRDAPGKHGILRNT